MKLKFIFYTISIMLPTSITYAQVKIGTNPGTIGTTSNLEVEATSGQKVIVDKTDGTVIIQNTPAASVNTSAVLTVESNGLITKKTQTSATLPIVFGTFGSGRDISVGNSYLGTGSSITLPPNSTYVINFVLTVASSAVNTSAGSGLMRATLSDSNADGVSASPDILGKRAAFSPVSPNAYFSTYVGSIVIKNPSTSSKTYYLKGLLEPNNPAGGSNNLPAGYYAKFFGSNIYSEGQFYGIPVTN